MDAVEASSSNLKAKRMVKQIQIFRPEGSAARSGWIEG
jgi:hypothetical protein